MLRARGLTYAVNGRTLLDDVDVAVPPGRVTVLIGPNGAGKSMLLRCLAGELAATGGAVLLDDSDLRSIAASELARRRAVVSQASLLTFPFTVHEVAMLGATVPGFDGATPAARKAALDALDAMGLTAIAERLYVHLSGGERQRVHIARALCQLATAPAPSGETRCFLLDEPTSSLDLAHQTMVLRAIRQHADRGYAILVVLHDLNLAAALADELVLLAGGRVAAAGPVSCVLRDDLLSAAYGCPVEINRVPDGDRPFVLPPAVFLTAAGAGTARHSDGERDQPPDRGSTFSASML